MMTLVVYLSTLALSPRSRILTPSSLYLLFLTIIFEFIDSVPTEFSGLDSSCITTHTENYSDDTSILSNSSSERLRTEPRPKEFIIPSLSFETEGQLEKGNAEYLNNQTRLTPWSKMLSGILERLAEKICFCQAYPTDADLSDVTVALTKHPCLRQPDSFNESYGLKWTAHSWGHMGFHMGFLLNS